MLRRDPAVERDRGLDDPLSPEFQALRERAQMEGTAAAAGPTLGILAGGAGLGALGAVRAGGAVAGGMQGYKRGGVPGAVAGAAGGAAFPAVATGADIGDLVGGGAGGAVAGGVAGAVAGGLLGNKLKYAKAVYDTVKGMRGAEAAAEAAPAIAREVQAVKTAAQTAKALSPEKEALLAASRAAREAKAAEAVKQARVVTPRIDIGAEKVARQTGKTIEQIRQEAGPVLGEAAGEASMMIPKKAWARIMADMKALPPEARAAYVSKARGAKNQAQLEQLRRTYEELGLLVPVGLGAGVAAAGSEGLLTWPTFWSSSRR